MGDRARPADDVSLPTPGGRNFLLRAYGGWPTSRFDSSRGYLTMAVVLGAVVIVKLSYGATQGNAYLVDEWLGYTIAAQGFYWIFGLGGRFAFCQTLMMAIGGYMSATVTRHFGSAWFPVGVAAAIGLAAAVALLIGLATFRTSHFYLAIATLAVTEVGLTVFTQTSWFSGPNGTTTGIAPPQLGPLVITSETGIFWLFLVVLGLVYLVSVWIEASPVRREALAAQENPVVATAAGVPAVKLALVLFVLGSAVGGLAGALIASWGGTVETTSFGLSLAIGIFFMVLLGGIRSPWGPILGAAVYVGLPHFLTALQSFSEIVYGGLLLLIVIALPGGIVGSIRYVRPLLASLFKARGREPPRG